MDTWPHDEERLLHIVSYPGEKGTNSIPRAPGIRAHVFQKDPAAKQSSQFVVNEVRQRTVDILAGKYGKCHVFAGDGLHKLCEYYLDVASGGAYFKGQDFEPKLYTKCYAAFLDYLDLVMSSPVEYAVFTIWDGKEPDEYKGADRPRLYPELPGKLAKKIIGEFSVRLFAYVKENPGPSKPAEARWQLKQDAKVGGVGVKLPQDVMGRLPDDVEQDWQKLERVILGEEKAA